MTTDDRDSAFGTFHRSDDPSWESLYAVLQPRTVADLFSWMGDVALDDGTVVHVYRQYETRAFLHVTDDGRALIYTGGDDRNRYRFVPTADAVVNAFASRQDPIVRFDDDAGCAALDALFEIGCEVSDSLGISPPERDGVIDAGDGE